jgi:hypothetical protein
LTKARRTTRQAAKILLAHTKLPFGELGMSRLLKALPTALALAALSIFASSCGSSNAQVRFVDAIQDGAAMDIDINGTQEFTDIAFLGVQPTQPGYTSVPSGSDSIEGFLTGQTTVGFNNTSIRLNGSQKYTVVATGFVANGQNAVILSIPDNIPSPSGQVAFRVIHASPSGPGSVDVYILLNPVTGPTGNPAISGLAYTQASSYVSLTYNPNNNANFEGFTVYVTASNGTQPIISEPINPQDGAVRTLVLTDVQGGTTMNPTFLELSDLN